MHAEVAVADEAAAAVVQAEEAVEVAAGPHRVPLAEVAAALHHVHPAAANRR